MCNSNICGPRDEALLLSMKQQALATPNYVCVPPKILCLASCGLHLFAAYIYCYISYNILLDNKLKPFYKYFISEPFYLREAQMIRYTYIYRSTYALQLNAYWLQLTSSKTKANAIIRKPY